MEFDSTVDPFEHLDRLVGEAERAGIKDANAMALATVDSNSKPSVRIVLYKGLIRGGLSFYTNYEGRKGRELEAGSLASVCFFWASQERQVRVEGSVARLTRAESEAYFRTRPRLSQLSAWASRQSDVLSGVDELQARIDEMDDRFSGQDVPCPPNWGGYHLIPSSFEFWFGHLGRLHHRYCYERVGGGWRTFMRYP